MVQTLLISGTDTEVGKTVLTSALLSYWQIYRPQERIAVFKPLQSGPGDREWYTTVFKLEQAPTSINTLYYEQPLAPPLAAEQSGQVIDLSLVWNTLQSLQAQFDWVFIEGVGSLGSPVTHELIVADLARDWRIPIVLVVPVRLGCIGQAVAHMALARQSQLQVKGIILNLEQSLPPEDIEKWAPITLMQTLTHVPVLGVIPYLDAPANHEQLAQSAAQLDLEALGSLT